MTVHAQGWRQWTRATGYNGGALTRLWARWLRCGYGAASTALHNVFGSVGRHVQTEGVRRAQIGPGNSRWPSTYRRRRS